MPPNFFNFFLRGDSRTTSSRTSVTITAAAATTEAPCKRAATPPAYDTACAANTMHCTHVCSFTRERRYANCFILELRRQSCKKARHRHNGPRLLKVSGLQRGCVSEECLVGRGRRGGKGGPGISRWLGTRAGGAHTAAAVAAVEQLRCCSCGEQQPRAVGTRPSCKYEALQQQTIKIGRAFRDTWAAAQMRTPSALARNKHQI